MAKTKKVKPLTPWEIAKPLLEQDYLAGEITDDMPPRFVVLKRDEFKEVKYENFTRNFNEMKKRIRKHKARSMRDNVAFTHDTSIYELAKDKASCWDGSDAQLLLMVDVKCNMHKFMKPKQLWQFRPEYKVFSLDVFRDHIYQESRSALETNYWLVKRKKKEAKLSAGKKKQNIDEDDDDDDLDFFGEHPSSYMQD